uniref:RING-type domain-containing protein n=1 Tax=Strongyloides stercoralis TaxID=6248 RepID=A0A0K0DYK2_STRER
MAGDNNDIEGELKDKLIYEENKKGTILNDDIKNDMSKINFNCSICFQSFTEDGGTHTISTLPCGHIFGKSCLIKWFSIQVTDHYCPICRCLMSDLKLKINDNVYNSIIPLHGLTKNTSFETVILERQKLIDDYEGKIKELSTENIKLKEQLNNNLRLRREAFTLRSFAFDIDDEITGYERMLNELSSTEYRVNINSSLSNRRVPNFAMVFNQSQVENSSNNNDFQTQRRGIEGYIHSFFRNFRNPILPNRSARNIIENIYNSGGSLLSNERYIDFMDVDETARQSRIPSAIYTATRKYRVHFDETIDSAYSNGLVVTAVKRIIRNTNIHNFGLSFFRYLRGSVYVSLSDQEIVAVRVIKDSILPNIQKVIAVCNKGKFYNIQFDEEDFRIISKFEGIIGQSQTFSGRVTLLHKPTGLTWLTPNKYAIGTKRGHVFVRTFFDNSTRWQSINRYTNTYGVVCTGLMKPILMLQSINEHAVICFQANDICIFDERGGREVVYKCMNEILSINFNKYSNTLAVIIKILRDSSEIKTFRVENLNQFFENGKKNYGISFLSSNFHNDPNTKKRELNSIVLRTNNIDTYATFWLDEVSGILSLKAMSGNNNLMNQISVDPSRVIKVCNEEGVYSINDSQKLNYIIVSTTHVTVYELGITSS